MLYVCVYPISVWRTALQKVGNYLYNDNIPESYGQIPGHYVILGGQVYRVCRSERALL